ncbi:MAG: ATP-binding protein [Thermodesulfobacteriota bacterium]
MPEPFPPMPPAAPGGGAQAPAGRPGRGLRQRFAVAVCLVVIVPLILLGLTLSVLVYSSQREQILDLEREVVKRARNEIALATHELESMLHVAMLTGEILDLGPADRENLLQQLIFVENAGGQEIIEELLLVDRSGQERAHVSRVDIFTSADRRDWAGRAEIQEPLATGKHAYGPVVVDEENLEPWILHSMPITNYPGGPVQGVLLAKLRISAIWRPVVDRPFGERGLLFITDATGRVVAHPNISATLSSTFFLPGIDEGRGHGLEGEDLLLVREHFDLHQQRFFLVATTPHSEVLHTAWHSLGTTGVFVLVFLVAGTALGLAVIGRLVGPIENLAQRARQIGAGDLGVRAPLVGSDELGDLAASFNAMTDELVAKIDLLATREAAIQDSYQVQALLNRLLELSLTGQGLDEILRRFIETVTSFHVFGLEHTGVVFLREGDVLKMKAASNLAEPLRALCAEVALGQCCCGKTALSREVLFADRVDERHDITYPGMPPHGHYCVPIVTEGSEVLGVFTCYTKAGYRRSDKLEAALKAAGSLAARIIRAKLAEEEQDKLRAQLRQSQKLEAIGTLAGGIAHDFNNILCPIVAYSELGLAEVPRDSKVHGYLAGIGQAARRASQLVQQILSFSRRNSQEVAPVELQVVIKEALKLLRASIPTFIQIRTNIDPRCGPVLANPVQIHQVLMNLCTNAYHAMRTSGGTLGVTLLPVRISAGDKVKGLHLAPGPYLRLEVSDTGSGMERAVLERIFEPYFTTKEKGEGTGLGLAVVHGIMQSLGGHVTVYSEVGQGTTFHLYFPERPATSAAAAIDSEAPLPKGSERLLFVDDEAVIVDMARQVLAELGYQVTAFTDPQEALASFQAAPDGFDLLMTDMTMPKLTGDRLAHEARALRPGLPVVLCTGFSEILNEESAKAAGIDEYVTKPMGIRTIATVVRRALDRAAARRP